ncbi:hypothetical protein QBC38DRAFT_389036 [Podospora fimiseda]|uniref:Uncharacterized protein n=1 Tax=Podospora fimiseda TaxID=252190 RepID=A0AAN7H3P5_9PEZI|nr:hypothetical protein QBC38DRAFT_389036 [Podospora fimiseda]
MNFFLCDLKQVTGLNRGEAPVLGVLFGSVVGVVVQGFGKRPTRFRLNKVEVNQATPELFVALHQIWRCFSHIVGHNLRHGVSRLPSVAQPLRRH